MERLEIYNEREKKSFEIDLKPDSAVSLQLKSNIFSPIDKIVLNHSFSITAPDTLRNRRAFGVGNQVAAESELVRMKFPCRFYRNGVLLFNGTCHIQSIESGSFSLLLIWGLDSLEALKDGGDLADLDLGNMTFDNAGEVPREDWHAVPSYDTFAKAMQKDVFFAHSAGDCAERNNYNKDATDQLTPCVAARAIFKKCLQKSNVCYEVDEAAFEFMNRLAIPLASLDTGDVEITVGRYGSVNPDVVESYQLIVGGLTPAYYISGFSVVGKTVTTSEAKLFNLSNSADVRISYHIVGDAFLGYYLENFRIGLVEYDDAGNETNKEYKKIEWTRADLKGETYIYYFDDVEFSTSGKSAFYFVFAGTNNDVFKVYVDKLIVNISNPVIVPDMELSIAANLPRMSQINYVKALCQICGIFPIPPLEGSKVVRFVTPHVLEANKEKAVDWSDYVNGEPKKINFAFSDFAQNNLITYKDGEKYAASFPMESPGADKEKTAIELPFMHLVGGRWPLWSVEGEEKDDKMVYEWSRESVDPAIYYIRPSGMSDDSDAFLSFDEIAPATILKRWQPLADAVKRAKVVQVELLLPQIAVKYVDYSVPVYIEKLGGYFGIVSLTNSGSKTTAELIKI